MKQYLLQMFQGRDVGLYIFQFVVVLLFLSLGFVFVEGGRLFHDDKNDSQNDEELFQGCFAKKMRMRMIFHRNPNVGNHPCHFSNFLSGHRTKNDLFTTTTKTKENDVDLV
jgi:hypothetical protein